MYTYIYIYINIHTYTHLGNPDFKIHLSNVEAVDEVHALQTFHNTEYTYVYLYAYTYKHIFICIFIYICTYTYQGNPDFKVHLSNVKAVDEVHALQTFHNTLASDPDKACYAYPHCLYAGLYIYTYIYI
jgi:hypothetical protein